MQSSSRDFEAYHTSKSNGNNCGQTREWIARTDGTYFQRNRIKPAAFNESNSKNHPPTPQSHFTTVGVFFSFIGKAHIF
ncbi:hypothetical protein YC2023_104348 [Brassica napus]